MSQPIKAAAMVAVTVVAVALWFVAASAVRGTLA
jgi:hypothetical protein